MEKTEEKRILLEGKNSFLFLFLIWKCYQNQRVSEIWCNAKY